MIPRLFSNLRGSPATSGALFLASSLLLWLVLCLVLCLPLVFSPGAVADDDPTLETLAQHTAPTAFADENPKPIPGWGVGEHKSYWVPVLDILLFDLVLNRYNRRFSGSSDYEVSYDTFEDNLTGAWVYDQDEFAINQFGHPYQGSMYHGFARSAGLSYWESSAYTLLGSAVWEVAGENTPPSINDQFTTGFGGSFLGEPLFRLASLLLESGDSTGPGFWRELGAAALSPSTGYNRLVYGSRFDVVFRSKNPAVYTRIDLGMTFASRVRSNVTTALGADSLGVAVPHGYKEGEMIADFTVGYGLPGKPGYAYDRPFDYFHLQVTAASSNAFENIMSRGLLYGSAYQVGNGTRGVWGLYGTYDYIAPQIFRVSSTAAQLGTTVQTWLARKVALQGSAMAGVGYGSAGTIRSVGEKDYHNGFTSQGLLALRLIFGERLSIDLTVRDFYLNDGDSDDGDLGGRGSGKTGGVENIKRADVSVTLRVYNLHGITLKYVESRRDAHYTSLPDTEQKVGSFSLGYAYLGQTRSGAVDWRPKIEGGP